MLVKLLFLVATTLSVVNAQGISDACAAEIDPASPYGIQQCLDFDVSGTIFMTPSVTNLSLQISQTICPAPACNPADLARLSTEYHAACASDFSAAGVATGNATILDFIFANIDEYPAYRETICLQAKTNQSYCVIEYFSIIDKALGFPFNGTTPQSVTQAALNATDASVFCTDCVKAVAIASKTYFPFNSTTFLSSNLQELVLRKCGSNALDALPDTVVDSANNATLPQNSTSATTTAAAASGTATAAGSGSAAASGSAAKTSGSASASAAASTAAKSAGTRLATGSWAPLVQFGVVVSLLCVGGLLLV